MAVSGFQKREKQAPMRHVLFKSLLVSYILLSDWIAQVIQKTRRQRVTSWRPLLPLSPLPKTLVSGDFLSHASESNLTLLVGDKL